MDKIINTIFRLQYIDDTHHTIYRSCLLIFVGLLLLDCCRFYLLMSLKKTLTITATVSNWSCLLRVFCASIFLCRLSVELFLNPDL